MNREQMTAPFAEEELRQFTGRGGKVMTFIEDETVMDRLDAGYGPGNWSILVDVVSEKVVKVRLGVRDHAEWTWFEDFGYPNQDGGEMLKEAVSDGIRRCGRYVGIARDLYRKATYEPGGALGPRPTSKAGGIVSTSDHPQVEVSADGGLIGTAITEGKYDFGLRQTPDGLRLPFRVKNGSKSFIVIAEDALAEVLAPMPDEIIGKRITVWGHWSDETIPAKGTKPEIRYRILHLERLATPDFVLPAPAFDSPLDEPSDDVELFAEAETAPLGLVG